MKQETIYLSERGSAQTGIANLIISARSQHYSCVEIVVGSPGMANITKELYVGDTILFESIDDGILEIRLMSIASGESGIRLLVTQISPRPGLRGALIDEDPLNSFFTDDELERIESSINEVKKKLGSLDDIKPEQVDLIDRKLDDIISASSRMGRKDWITFITGTLTNLTISAAFSPAVSKFLFGSVSAALSWLFDNALKLIA